MRSESTSAFGQPRLTKPTLGFCTDMGNSGRRTDAAPRAVRRARDYTRPAAPLPVARPGAAAAADAAGTPSGRIMAPPPEDDAMGHWIQLDTPRGPVATWQAGPPTAPRGGLVVIQEIFGVNPHMRAVAEDFVSEGYAVLVPSFFDPVERGVELGYDEAGYAHGRKLAGELGFDAAVQILDAAARRLRRYLAAFNEPRGGVGTVGYCWGGTLAMLGALRLGLPSVS